MAAKSYVDHRNGGLYIAGTRIGLDVLHEQFYSGRSPEEIIQDYPSMGSLGKVYGAIAYMLSNPEQMQTYLAEQDRRFAQIQRDHEPAVALSRRAKPKARIAGGY